MKDLIKIKGAYGAKVGNLTVFTKEGALNAYNIFLGVCYKDFCMESCAVLGDVEADLMKIGFTLDELEKIEIEFLKAH